jgi:hypothetical protein
VYIQSGKYQEVTLRDKNLLGIEITFFLTGSLVGILFVWLLSIPRMVDFWFVQGNQFLIPKVNYWVVFGVLLASGLSLGYSICISCGWLTFSLHWAELRLILAGLILLLAFPSGYLTGYLFVESIDPMLAYSLACLVSISFISVALWLFTSTWKTWLAILMLLAIPLSYILTIGVYRSLDLSNLAYDILRMGSLSGLLSGISGYWLATPRSILLTAENRSARVPGPLL